MLLLEPGAVCSRLSVAEQLTWFADCGDFKENLINPNAGGCTVTMLQNIPAFRHFLFLSFEALNMKSRLWISEIRYPPPPK